jgi:hypothetical protein
VTVVYDAGALIAADRNDRRVWAEHRARLEAGIVPFTTAPVVAQASRSARQVQLRRFLAGCDVVAFHSVDAHTVGMLLARASRSDVVDAHVVLSAFRHGRGVLTSDVGGLQALAEQLQSPVPVELRRV